MNEQLIKEFISLLGKNSFEFAKGLMVFEKSRILKVTIVWSDSLTVYATVDDKKKEWKDLSEKTKLVIANKLREMISK